jgi:hypothetical protein
MIRKLLLILIGVFVFHPFLQSLIALALLVICIVQLAWVRPYIPMLNEMNGMECFSLVTVTLTIILGNAESTLDESVESTSDGCKSTSVFAIIIFSLNGLFVLLVLKSVVFGSKSVTTAASGALKKASEMFSRISSVGSMDDAAASRRMSGADELGVDELVHAIELTDFGTDWPGPQPGEIESGRPAAGQAQELQEYQDMSSSGELVNLPDILTSAGVRAISDNDRPLDLPAPPEPSSPNEVSRVPSLNGRGLG